MKSYTSLSLALVLAAGCAPDTSAGTSGSSSSEGGSIGSGGASSAETGPTAEASSSASGVVVASASSGDTTSAGGSDTTSGNGGAGEGGATGPSSGSGGEDTSSATGGAGQGGSNPDDDEDGDTFTVAEGDCRDNNAAVNPGATEACNFIDDNCDDQIDEGFDVDADTFTTCNDDCDDDDSAVNPAATEVDNDVDDDCNGGIDEPFTDDDGDGFTEAQGDCNDDEILVNPDALEFDGNDVDDDCDGTIDEALAACDGGSLNSNDPLDYAKAIGLCNDEVVSASFGLVPGPATARAILSDYGTNNGPLNQPVEGDKIIHLSAGRADTSTKDRGYAYDGSFGGGCTSATHPNPLPDPGSCGAADPATVCDKTELSIRVKVPTNAQSFSYQFQFYSTEYPTFRCTSFDDTFLAMLSSGAVNGGTPTNISFDALNRVVSVNTGFFQICNDVAGNDCTVAPAGPLGGTGYYPFNGGLSSGAGATVPLTTTSPAVPGETMTIRFIIFDEGDDQLDSSVVVDGWQWSLDPADGPVTDPT